MANFRSAAIFVLLAAVALCPQSELSGGDETSSSPRGSAFPPSGEVGKLARLLLEGDASESAAGLVLDADDSRVQAMRRLSEIATAEAVEVLSRFLARPDADRKLKGCAVAALGRTGTKEAVDALGRFEQWAEWRRTVPAPFSFGEKEYAIDHFGPTRLESMIRHKGPDGRWWAVFEWDKFGLQNDEGGKPDWWVTSSTDCRFWAPPILIERREPVMDWLRQVAEDPSRLAEFTRDLDADGLPDLVERRYGTDPESSDSDGDGVEDGRDGNPLTPAGQVRGDEAAIRQAVFLILFATCDSDYPIYVVPPGEFADQEYRGYQGAVLRSPAIKPGRVNITGIEVEMKSPTSAVASITDYEASEAASGHRAVLEKVHGKWVVVDFLMTRIS
jgi:hypothetical protein